MKHHRPFTIAIDFDGTIADLIVKVREIFNILYNDKRDA